jgi:phosphomannomutase
MSNLGLERYLSKRNLRLVRTKVGDRYVLERMRADGFNLGGEQSGHIIMTDHATTGDGLMAALQAMGVMIKSDRPASETFRAFEPVPQLLKNVRICGDAKAMLAGSGVKQAIAAAEVRLGVGGRVLVRNSGHGRGRRFPSVAQGRRSVHRSLAARLGVTTIGRNPTSEPRRQVLSPQPSGEGLGLIG